MPCLHPSLHEYIKTNAGAMTFAVRIIRADIIPHEEIDLGEPYYMSVAAMAPDDTRRVMTLKGGEGRVYVFYYNVVDQCDSFDFESQFMMNCCL
jgi:hypothetical protein